MASNRASALAAGITSVVALSSFRTHCTTCGLRRLCLPMDLPPDVVRQLDQIISQHRGAAKRETLFRPGDPFTALYVVRLGTFKTVVLAEDGREQIVGYHLAGDVIGLDGIGARRRHACEAVALEDSEVCIVPFERLDSLAQEVPALQTNIYTAMSKLVQRDQEMMMLLGSRSAEERLALFLLDLARRYQALGYSPSEFMLRMTREEIASYLGLKLETVSRLFSRLQEEGLLQVEGRSVKLLDSSALRNLVGH